ncbi:MAG: hypothetical protein R2831_04050 [Chitinophagaceae bacterium]
MKQATILFLLFVMAIQADAKKKRKYISSYATIKATVTETRNFCGGMLPSPEILKEFSTPRPLANKTIHIKLGSVNSNELPIYKTVQSDENGHFTFSIKKGQTIMFLEDWKGYPFVAPENTETITWSISCLKNRYATPDLLYRVTYTSVQKVEINFMQPCPHQPLCGRYHGYMPE